MIIYAQNGTIATLTNGSHTDNLNYFFYFSGSAYDIFPLCMMVDLDERYAVFILRSH